MKKIFLLFTLTFTLVAFSQKSDLKGKNLINYKRLKYIKTNAKFGKVTLVKPYQKDNPQFSIETLTQPQFIYKSATAIPINKQNASKGTVFLLTFSAKTTKSSLETGEAKVNLLFKQSTSYKNNIVSTQSLSSNWKTYYVPFQSDINIDKKDLAIVMHYGFKPQAFLIKDLSFQVFPEGTKLSSLPKTKIVYRGMEEDAKWRKDALKRIEAIRKGNIQVQFTKNGKPLANKSLQIKLKKHFFPFGTAISAKEITQKPEDYKNFKKAFNHVVLANDLKIKSWQWEKKRPTTLKALEMLSNDGYKVKGHVLIWPGFNYLTQEIKDNKDNPTKVKEIINNHLNIILDVTKGKISHWDVVNEAYTNKDLQKITGSEEILYNGFRVLKQKQPNVKAFTNEYGIISKGGLDTKKQEWYYNFVKRIDVATNGKIDGIGIQSHIGSDLTPPEKVLELLGYYATLGKQISISEFTMDIQDPMIREQYTKDFMIAALSHPSVSEFLFWGYVKDERKKVDIFNKDGSLGAMGKAYFSLVHDAWKTNLVGKTNAEGFVNGRGFFGTYEYTFVENGKVINGTFKLNPRQRGFIKINIE